MTRAELAAERDRLDAERARIDADRDWIARAIEALDRPDPTAMQAALLERCGGTMAKDGLSIVIDGAFVQLTPRGATIMANGKPCDLPLILRSCADIIEDHHEPS